MNKGREHRLLRAKEAAEYLGISVVTLSRMEKQGTLLPYRTPGGHRRYSIEMLEEYLENSRKGPPASESPPRSEGADGNRKRTEKR